MSKTKINPGVFRAYDIRGIYKKDINEDLFRKIGFVLGAKNKKFLVGNDVRKSGRKLSQALIEGLNSAGAEVICSGTTSIGQAFFTGWQLKVDKSLFITASHLPPEWNGLKIYLGNGGVFPEKAIKKLRDDVLKIENKKIKNRASKGSEGEEESEALFAFQKAKFKKVDMKKEYIDFFLKKFSNLKNNNLRMAVDCGNGAMSLVAPEVFQKVGFKVLKLYCRPSPNFPNRTSEPTFEATKSLRKLVVSKKADFGVAFDGDGDRAVLIDDKGRYLKGDQLGIVIAKLMLKNSKNKKIVATLPCSMALEEQLKGAKIFRIPVGHTFVILNCQKRKALFGMEESGHFCLPQYFLFDDAILIPFKIAEAILDEKKKLSEIINKIKIYPYQEIKFDCPDEIKFKVLKNLSQLFLKKYRKVNRIDGLKVNLNSGWILIRPSNTSPILRLYVEAKSKSELKNLKEKFSKILKKEIENLSGCPLKISNL